jgi:hypothetical protein
MKTINLYIQDENPRNVYMNRGFKILLIFVVFIIYVSCNKSEPLDLKSKGEYLRLLQNTPSGNCALIEKTIGTDGNTIYSAKASNVNSGRCEERTFHTLTSNPEEAKIGYDAYYNGMALTFNKYSECTDLVKTSISNRESVTSNSLSESAKASASGCILVVPKVYLCKDDASLNSLKGSFRYLSISNAKVDMKLNYDSTVASNAIINKSLDLKYEEVVIGNLRIANPGEITIFEGAEANALLPALTQDAACFKKVILGNTNLKSAYAKIPSVQEFFKEEINVSDRKAVTETITPNLFCRYGANVSETQVSGATAAIGICPPNYPIY